MEDEDMKYCKICLVTDCEMFWSPSISEAYSQLLQVVFCADYKLYVCYECKHLLRKCQEFRSKCLMALKLLSSIRVDHTKIPTRIVRGIDRKHFKLESKLSRSSMLVVCNSNQQIVLPVINLDSDVEIDTNPDAPEDDKPEIKFDIYAEDKEPCSDTDIKNEIDTYPNALEDDKPEKKFKIDAEDVFSDIETHDTDYPNEIMKSSHEPNNIVPEIKDVFSDIEMHDTDYPNEIMKSSHEPNNIVPEIKSEQKSKVKSKKTKEKVQKKIKNLKRIPKKRNLDLLPLNASSILSRAPTKNMMQIFEKYAKVDVMTLSEAKEEMLLKKESSNYKCNVHTCELCCKGFSTESSYNKHMMHHRPDSGTEECDICHLFFPRRRDLARHIEGCHKFKISCKLCLYVCFSPTQAKNHIAAVHKGESYTCELCKMSFRYSNSLINHKRLKHPGIVCAHCGSMFASLKGLSIHKYRAHKQDSTELLGPKCEECDVQFATETAWKRHLVLSSKHTVRNGCEECGETFFSADELKSHAKEHPQKLDKAHYYATHRRGSKLPTVCKLCDKRMETHNKYKKHMKSAHPNQNSVESQIQLQYDNMQYICEVCGKVFKTSMALKYHTNKHTGELPYECDQCDKKYANPVPLFKHKACHHSGAPRFTCDVCQKGFYMKNILRKHMIMVHLGVRRFQCKICNKLYGHPCEVRTHMEHVHFNKPWPKRDRTKRRNKED